LLGGLHVNETCELRWGDVDLGSGRITVHRSKAAAGVRQVDALPALRDELTAYRPADADGLAFTTGRGTSRDKDNVAGRVISPVLNAPTSCSPAGMKRHCPRGTQLRSSPPHLREPPRRLRRRSDGLRLPARAHWCPIKDPIDAGRDIFPVTLPRWLR
jgi:hypothetical protein